MKFEYFLTLVNNMVWYRESLPVEWLNTTDLYFLRLQIVYIYMGSMKSMGIKFSCFTGGGIPLSSIHTKVLVVFEVSIFSGAVSSKCSNPEVT